MYSRTNLLRGGIEMKREIEAIVNSIDSNNIEPCFNLTIQSDIILHATHCNMDELPNPGTKVKIIFENKN